jgi:hypothetical protein
MVDLVRFTGTKNGDRRASSLGAGSMGSWAGSWGSGCVFSLARRARRSSLVEGEDGSIG